MAGAEQSPLQAEVGKLQAKVNELLEKYTAAEEEGENEAKTARLYGALQAAQRNLEAAREPAAAAAGLFEEIKDLVSRLEHRIEDLTVQVENKNNTGFSQHSRDDAERARAKQKACELQKACEQDDVGAAQCVACEPDAQCSHVEFAHMLARGASAFLVHRFGQQFQPMLAWVCMDSARMHFYATFNPKLGMSTKRHRYVLVHCVRLPSGRIVSLGPVDSYMKMLPLCKSLHKVFDECGGLFLSTQPHKLPGVMKREGVSKMSAKRFKKVARRVGGDPVSPVPDPFGSNSKGENSEDDSSGSSSNDNDGGSGGGTASDDEPVFQSDEEPQSVLCNGCNRYHSFSSFGNTDLTIQKMPETWCSLCQSYREAPHDPRTMYLCCNLREQSQSARDLLLSETQKLGELSRARKLVEVAHTVASGSPVQARACDEETDDHIEAKVNVNHDSGFCSIELRCGAGYLGEYFNTYGMAAFLHCCAEVQQTILHHAGEKSNSAAAAAAAALEEEAAEDPGDDE